MTLERYIFVDTNAASLISETTACDLFFEKVSKGFSADVNAIQNSINAGGLIITRPLILEYLHVDLPSASKNLKKHLLSQGTTLTIKSSTDGAVSQGIHNLLDVVFDFYFTNTAIQPCGLLKQIEKDESCKKSPSEFYTKFIDNMSTEIQESDFVQKISFDLAIDAVNKFIEYILPTSKELKKTVRKKVTAVLAAENLQSWLNKRNLSGYRRINNDLESVNKTLKSPFLNAGKLKENGDTVDAEFVHFLAVGYFSGNKLFPVIGLTCDQTSDIIERVQQYSSLFAYATKANPCGPKKIEADVHMCPGIAYMMAYDMGCISRIRFEAPVIATINHECTMKYDNDVIN